MRICFIDFRERKSGRGKERDRSIGCLTYVPQPGIQPTAFWCTGMTADAPIEPPGQVCFAPSPGPRRSVAFLNTYDIL